MARIEGLPAKEAAWPARFAYWMTRRRYKRDLEPTLILGHCPGILWGWGVLQTAIDRANRLDRRVKDLVTIRVASLVGCPF